MYIVKKKIKGKDYWYLRKSVRENGKVKSKNIAYLGKTREEAEKKAKEIMRQEKIEKGKEKTKKEKRLKEELSIEDMTSFCKRKGFVYLSGEIYGGFAGFWDFGSNCIKKEWWKFFVSGREDVVGIDGSIITHPKTWEASGHVESFFDLLVFCKKCKKANKIDEFQLSEARCEFCGGELDKERAKNLNLMFSTQVGFIKQEKAYLRPETAQLIFTNFKQVAENSRLKLPFGIAQIGKAFRNEIAPRDFLFRAREFEQMEIEYFIFPKEKCPYKIPDVKVLVFSAENQREGKEAEEMKIREALDKKIIKRDWHAYWLASCLLWFKSLGCNLKNFRIRQHQRDELAHYSSDCWDLEYRFPFGWKELTGIADRNAYDLSRHEKFSGEDLKIHVEGKGKILPEVVAEPSFGVERSFLVFMFEAYNYDEKRQNIVLKLHPKLAPVKVAVFPIVKKKSFVSIARKIYDELRKDFNVVYDEGGSIGRRYARQDEIGTPFCITIDGESVKKNTVTIRDRDTTEQIRVKISDLKEIIGKLLSKEMEFSKAGKKISTRKKEI